MIKFKNINGDVFLAVGSIKRKSALNGEKSLSGTLFEGDDVLNKIDKGWSLDFDNEPYVVTYFERNDNDNTVEFDAIHKFFWDMNKDVLYFSWSGSHTAKAYLDQIFNGTGYTYALNFEPSAFEKDNWGMKNKLSLFNDVIDSMGGEFEINGTLVSIFKNVGSDVSTIVRHGFNLSDMSLENDNTDFVTYGEGFGAYADQENQTGERLHVTYTSQLAKTFGKLHAEPIDDQRYTIKDNLLQAIKDKVDGSFAISIKLSLYDLTAAGYPYKMANVGDWLLAIDENLDFKQKIRIISVDDEFATDGTRISYTVTCGDVGVVQKYQQANASIGQKVDSAYQNAQDAKESSIQAVIAANGKNTNYYVDGVENLPTTANEGDIAFVQTGDGQAMYIWTKMPDGSFKWVKRVDPDTGEQIAAGVDDAIKQAQSQAAAMDEVLASEAAVFQSEANTALSSAADERAAFSSNATSMANSAASRASSLANSAAAYGKAQAASALSRANSALSEAKSDLTTAINQEISDRNEAVQTVNSQAQDYTNQAKSDAIAAAETADGVVRKDFKTTTDSLSSTITQNKKDTDGKISTAQTTATQALDGLKTKVSQTDYNTKTGQLQTDLTATSQTANQAKLDIVSIKSEADSQSEQINDIVSDAKGTKQTVSDLKTEQGKQSGSIATLQSRADGFDASITKINNFVNSQGQVNQLINTEFTPDLQGWEDGSDSSSPKPYVTGVDSNVNARVIGFKTGDTVNNTYARFLQWISTGSDTPKISLSWMSYASAGISGTANIYLGFADSTGKMISSMQNSWTNPGKAWDTYKWENISLPTGTRKIKVSFEATGGVTAYFAHTMLVFGSTIGNYVAGNYNNNQAVAQAQLTADKATLDLSNYQKDADGRISKAQTDITATSKEVSTKVSQSDYDNKTNDLSTKYGQVKATADEVTTDVANYKKSNDSKVSANTANITANAKAIALKVSQTDFDSNSKDVNTKIANQQITVDKISQSVTELQAKANAQGQVNQLMNTEFNPDLEGWTASANSGSNAPYRSYWQNSINATIVGFNTTSASASTYAHFQQTVQLPSAPTSGHAVSMSWYAHTGQTDNYNNLWVRFYDNSNTKLSESYKNWADFNGNTPSGKNSWNVQNKWENIAVPDTATSLVVSFDAREGTKAYLGHPMLVFGSTIGDYAPGNYNNNARVAAVELGIDHITGLVNDPKNGLSATATLAANGMTVATKAQSDATTAIQTAQGTQTTVTSVQKDVKDLQSTTTQTAGQVTTEIEDRKNGDKSTLTQTSQMISDKIADYNLGVVSTMATMANGIYASVSMPNKLFNTDFSPDLDGWDIYKSDGGGNTYRSYIYNASNGVGINTKNATDGHYGVVEQLVQAPSTIDANAVISMRWNVRTVTKGDATLLFIAFMDKNGSEISEQHVDWSADKVDGGIEEHKFENIVIPTGTVNIKVSFQVAKGNLQYLWKPMLVFNSSAPLSYMPGSYSGMNTSTVLSLLKDHWAIGIQDNTFEMVSGIIGDSTSMNLISNNITLRGNTTVTEDFYAKGGNFKNLNASNITTGTINAANINVINLDVSSLSGNITNFIKSYWNAAYSNVEITGSGMTVSTSGIRTTFDSTGAHYANGSTTAQYQFVNWKDDSGNMTNALGLNYGLVGTSNSYVSLVGSGSGSVMLYANENMNYGSNSNIVRGRMNMFAPLNMRNKLEFYANSVVQSTYIIADEKRRTLNFYTDNAYQGNGNYFWFNHNVLSEGTFNGSSLLSKKNVKSEFDTDALSEIAKTKLVNFEYKNNIGENHVSPIIDDINEEKQYYVPEKILSKDKEHVDMYSMISMAWKAIQQLDERTRK